MCVVWRVGVVFLHEARNFYPDETSAKNYLQRICALFSTGSSD